jgi:hypothetical protein
MISGRIKISFAVFSVFLFFCQAISYRASALTANPSAAPDPKTFATEENTTAAIDQVTKLPISRSPLLNEAAREEAQSAIAGYNLDLQQLNILLSRSVSDVDGKAKTLFDTLKGAVAPCNPTVVISAQRDLAGVYNYVAESHSYFQRVLTPETPFGIFDADEALRDIQPSDAPENKSAETFCGKYKTSASVTDLLQRYLLVLQKAEKRLQDDQNKAQDMIPRIQKITDSWTTRKTSLEKSIEDASPAGKVADQLWPILTVFCLFAVVLFGLTRIFPDSIQTELVASGQIIQFATVMVILIVVCVLGISGILKENTLGTLLGAIGGYVLSQGVGRAASRDATKAAVAGLAGQGGSAETAGDPKEPPDKQ